MDFFVSASVFLSRRLNRFSCIAWPFVQQTFAFFFAVFYPLFYLLRLNILSWQGFCFSFSTFLVFNHSSQLPLFSDMVCLVWWMERGMIIPPLRSLNRHG